MPENNSSHKQFNTKEMNVSELATNQKGYIIECLQKN